MKTDKTTLYWITGDTFNFVQELSDKKSLFFKAIQNSALFLVEKLKWLILFHWGIHNRIHTCLTKNTAAELSWWKLT